MKIFENVVENLELKGKNKKANALHQVAPIVFIIMQTALRKARMNGWIFSLLSLQNQNFKSNFSRTQLSKFFQIDKNKSYESH